jgi:hypothetical protein
LLTPLIIGLLAQAVPGPIPDLPTFNVATNSTYDGGQLTYDPTVRLWVGCLSRPFRYVTPADGVRRICGETSGVARIRVEMDARGLLTLRWNAGAGGICAVDGTCTSPMPYTRRDGLYVDRPPLPFRAYTTYNVLGGNLPPFLGQATITITAP